MNVDTTNENIEENEHKERRSEICYECSNFHATTIDGKTGECDSVIPCMFGSTQLCW